MSKTDFAPGDIVKSACGCTLRIEYVDNGAHEIDHYNRYLGTVINNKTCRYAKGPDTRPVGTSHYYMEAQLSRLSTIELLVLGVHNEL